MLPESFHMSLFRLSYTPQEKVWLPEFRSNVLRGGFGAALKREFIPLPLFGEYIRVGKGTAFGLGKCKIRVANKIYSPSLEKGDFKTFSYRRIQITLIGGG